VPPRAASAPKNTPKLASDVADRIESLGDLIKNEIKLNGGKCPVWSKPQTNGGKDLLGAKQILQKGDLPKLWFSSADVKPFQIKKKMN